MKREGEELMVEEIIKDFFISYTNREKDDEWAQWIAQIIEDMGYSTVLQAWDFQAGSNFVIAMDKASKQAKRTIAVLSPDYLDSGFSAAEWAAAFRQDPTGEKGYLVPIRIRKCRPLGLLGPIVYIDLVDLDEIAAREQLVDKIRHLVEGQRAKPINPISFPGSQT